MTKDRKNIPDEIYRGFDRWHLDNLPPIEKRRNHTILFKFPLSNDLSKPPEPYIGDIKWDVNHVRLPCAIQNVIETKYVDDVEPNVRPIPKKRWEIIRNAWSKNIQSTQDLVQAILTYNPEHAKSWKFEALHNIFDRYLNKSETELFFKETLPNIIRLALQLPDLIPGSIPLLKQNQNKSISISQQQIACILANAFLCTFPGRSGIYQWPKEFSSFPYINFDKIFESFGNASVQFIRCICNYFRRVCSEMPTGVVTFSRRSISKLGLPNWKKSQKNFTKSLLYVTKDGAIEDEGDGLLQVDFANRYLGGGILCGGCVQEEIRFMICPELICSRLFTEYLLDNECVTIMGAERFSNYKGYRFSYEWTGDHKDNTPCDSFRRRKCSIVAIDARPFRLVNDPIQYKENMLRRELNKAFVGFKHDLTTPAPGVATGNWGCGAFNGNKRLKSLIQLMACTVNDRPLVYFTFGNDKLCNDFRTFHKFLLESKITIAEVWDLLLQYSGTKSKEDLYGFIMNGHQKLCEGRVQPEGSSNSSKFDDFCSTFKHYFNVLTHKRPDVGASAKEGDALSNNEQRNLAGNSDAPSNKSGVQPSANDAMKELSNHKSNT